LELEALVEQEEIEEGEEDRETKAFAEEVERMDLEEAIME
jgi:hypothetical protein